MAILGKAVKGAVDSVGFVRREIPLVVSRYVERRQQPIVLMHGFLGFNRLGPIEYFQNVSQYLELQGFPTYVPTADPLHTFGYRAYEWFYGYPPPRSESDHISEAAREFAPPHWLGRRLANPIVMRSLRLQGIATAFLRHRQPVHLFAHSQASIGARYLVSPDGLGDWKPFASGKFGEDVADTTIADCVASITSIAGPHNGVMIADDTDKVDNFMNGYVLPWLSWFSQLRSEQKTDIYRVAREFGVDYMTNYYNTQYRDNPAIPYYSVAGVTNEYQVNKILRYFHYEMRHNDKYEMSDNDGLVPLGSAKWPVGPSYEPRRHIVPPLLRETDEAPKLERKGLWTFLGVIYADHIQETGMIVSYPRNPIFKHLAFFRGLARFVTGEHESNVRLQPNGRWKVPRGLEMMPQIHAPKSTSRSGQRGIDVGEVTEVDDITDESVINALRLRS